MDIGRGMDQP